MMSEIRPPSRLEVHYETRSEVDRLSNLKSKRTEFLTTNWVMERYLQPQSNILDIGAGAGCYSFHFAALGHKVVARDYVPYHIRLMEADPRCAECGIDAGIADARDLSEFQDAAFDAVLCLGPFYHIGPVDERKQCVSECLRVLKPGGILALAYINKFFVYVHMVKHRREYLSDNLREQIMNNEVVLRDDPDNLWFFDSPDEIESFIAGFNIERLTNAGTDGIAIMMDDTVDSFDDVEYQKWLKYHYSTCEEPSILGYSNHGMFVCRKQ